MSDQRIEDVVTNSAGDEIFEELGYEKDPNRLEDAEAYSEDEFAVPLDKDYIDPIEAAHGEEYTEPEDETQDPEAVD
jgi:hypothetical protein